MRRAAILLAVLLSAPMAAAQESSTQDGGEATEASGSGEGEGGETAPGPKKKAQVVDAATAAKAEKLFHEGRELMKKRSTLDRGCEVLQQSFDLQARGDTLLNLAECHRRQGKTASAWREFDEALDYALSADFKEAIEAAFVLREELAAKPVSYTHLTLPTIYSV